RAAHAAGELRPLVVRRHDHEAALLLALVDEVVDPVAGPVRPVLRPEIVEDDEVVAARVRRRLPVAVALAERVEPAGDVEEERRLPDVAPDDLAEDRDREVRLAGARVATQEKPLAQIRACAQLLRPLPAHRERVARVGNRLERLEAAAVVGGGDVDACPARVGLLLLILDLLSLAADGAVPLGGERVAEEGDLLGLELALALEAADDHHAPCARLANFAYLLMNATLKSPVGPLRCLATITSATPLLLSSVSSR